MMQNSKPTKEERRRTEGSPGKGRQRREERLVCKWQHVSGWAKGAEGTASMQTRRNDLGATPSKEKTV